MRTLNLGILAHVDAGKTTLTERLLHTAGIIDEPGSVDAGTTQTDTLERQRGITIKSAAVSFEIDDITVNLIDTPGHPDFIAEVDRALSVLDAVVLVISAVEGVQPQTRVLMRALRRLGLPALIFANKNDRRGARPEQVVRDIPLKLRVPVVVMGSISSPGTRDVRYWPYGGADATFTAELVEALANHDDSVIAAYVDSDGTVPYPRLRAMLAEQVKRARVYPIFLGSAITGAGIDALIAGMKELLPAAAGEVGGPPSGTVFKIERGPAGEKVAYVRMFAGTIRTRDRIRFAGREAKVTAISVFRHGSAVGADSIRAGQIGKLRGLASIRIGDSIGRPRFSARHFARPTLETVITPRDPARAGALHVALTQLAEQDPLIDVRQDEAGQQATISLYGEVQKQVVQATLATEYGLDVMFSQTSTICLERPVGTGEAVEIIGEDGNPFLATVGLRVEPAAGTARETAGPGHGGPGHDGPAVRFRLEVEPGSMPPAFFKAVEETVTETLRQGIYGWAVIDCVVTMTHSGYWARQSHSWGSFDKSMSSTAGDFRNLTPLVLMAALRQAGTIVLEPIQRFYIEAPAEATGTVLPVLAKMRAIVRTSSIRGESCVLEGEIAATCVHELNQRLPSLTSGEGLLEYKFSHYQPVTGEIPARRRTDHNPLDRKEYLLRVTGRI